MTVLLLVGAFQVPLFGAKGSGKEKKGVVLKFDGFQSRFSTQHFNQLKVGSLYRGSFNSIVPNSQGTSFQSIITYQKGNTTFIVPYRSRTFVNRFKTPEKSNYP